jgi:uncharacterized iron-regulated protein
MQLPALRRTLPLALALAAACAPRFDPRLVDAPVAGRRWVSTRHVSHPLVGKILEPASGRYVDEAALSAAVAAGDFVLLGETHDNPDHHLLQARLLRATIAAGRRPALAFEMLTTDQQAAVDAALARAPKDPDALAEAVAWKKSRWPEFELYRPIFAAGLEAGVPIVAANLPSTTAKQVVSKGADVLDEETRARLAREEPLAPAMLEELREEMRESHCGIAMPEQAVDGLVLAQRAKDAKMAERMLAAGETRGAVLVTGTGHVRRDRGVPAVLAKDAPGKKIVAVAFLEVTADATEPAAYEKLVGKAPLPFDFVVFTPAVEREDPCEGIQDRMKKAAARREKAAADAAPGR